MSLKLRTIIHYVKSVQIQSIFWSVFSGTEYRNLRSTSPHSVRIGKNTDQKKRCIWTLLMQFILSKTSSNETSLLDMKYQNHFLPLHF